MPSGSRTAHRSSCPSTLRRTSARAGGYSIGLARRRKSGPIWAMGTDLPFRISSITTMAECPFSFCIAMKDEILSQRALAYASVRQIRLGRQLGLGNHGIVFAAESKLKPLRSAIKIYKEWEPYHRERSDYERLPVHGVAGVEGFPGRPPPGVVA